MISIKKFLSVDNRESDEAHERMGSLLLQAIGLHAVEGERTDYDSFRAAIADLEKSLAHDPSPSNVLITTGAAVKALQDYNRRTSLFIRAKSGELQIIVGMLTGAMGQITTASQTSITRLQDLQKQIGTAVMVEDMRTVKLRLSECLQSMRTESDRQRVESVRVVAGMQEGLKKAQEPLAEETNLGAAEEADPATVLSLRQEAEAAMQRACDQHTHAFAALFVVSRLQAVNSRFGSALGDQVLIIFRNHLARILSAKDEVFRWDTESFLAVLHRSESGEQVRRELARFLSTRLEETFEIGNRSVTLPIASTWTVIPLFESGYNQNLRKLDAFRAASS
jgi:GGDEF domain-containing protein